MASLQLFFEGSDESFSVRQFSVHEEMSNFFEISLLAVSPHDDIDLDGLVGVRATFRIIHAGGTRLWTGVCAHIGLTHAEQMGLSSYNIQIVPDLWLLTQRCNYRVFQHMSASDIVNQVLQDWNLEPEWQIDESHYPKRDYRVQYGEADYSFMCRILEEAGISFYFTDRNGLTKLIFSDRPEQGEMEGDPIPYADNSTQARGQRHATEVQRSSQVRPGAHRIRDYDFRSPSFDLTGSAPQVQGIEGRYEQYEYLPGASLILKGGGSSDTPAADARGAVRADKGALDDLAHRRLRGLRGSKKMVFFSTNAIELRPGIVTAIKGHPRRDLGGDRSLLVTSTSLDGAHDQDWILSAQAVFTNVPYQPQQRTPKPVVFGLQSAVVVGPTNQEIHTDEFGRVRVQFHWDRQGRRNEQSSCWIRVSQGWAGAGFGMITIPRVGQEVLVGFLEGDPDQPIVVGRLFNSAQRVPYKLPDNETISTWKSSSSPGGDGFNEIKLEDAKGKELVYVQAQRDLKKLVKRNETEITRGSRSIAVGGKRVKRVRGQEQILVSDRQMTTLSAGQDRVVNKYHRELVKGDRHLHVVGDLRKRVDGAVSLIVGGDQQEEVHGRYARRVSKEVHVRAGTNLILEADATLCIKGPGGFITIGPTGITIQGPLVKINCGGSPISGNGSSPASAEDAEEVGAGEDDDA